MNTGGVEEGVGEMYGGNNMEIYSTLCKIDSQWEIAVWLRKLKQGICIYLEEWDKRLVPNRKRSMSRLYIVTLLI